MNNFIQEGKFLSVACSDPATPTSGAPVRFGSMTGVAVTAEGDGGNASTETTVAFGGGVYDLSVAGVNASGDSAVAVGDTLFYVDADTPKLSKKNTGYFFGFALETVESGATATINVLHVQSPGSGTIASDAVTTTKINANAVTAAKLTSTMATGYIPLALTDFRLIASNDIAAKNATDGGVISSDTNPILKRVNGATDKALRISWESASVIEIQAPTIAYPPDLDDSAPVTVCLFAGMKAGSVDTPVIAVSAWEGVGDTNAGGNTAALTTTAGKVTVAIAHGDVGAYPKCLSIALAPGAHNTAANDVYLYGAWIEYTRK